MVCAIPAFLKGTNMMKKFLAAGAAAALCSLYMAFGACAADSAAQYTLAADQTQITTGQTVELSLQCTSADAPTTALVAEFTIPDGYTLNSVKRGSGVESHELSYSYTRTELTILYLDNDGGETPLNPGEEVATVKLTAAKPGSGQPLVCTSTDASFVTADGAVASQSIDLNIDTVTVTGEAVAVPTTAPEVSVEGTTQTPAPTQAPGSTAAPESAPGTYAEDDTNSAAADTKDANAASAASGAQSAAASSAQDAAQDETPTPTPLVVVDEDGNSTQIMQNNSGENTVDVTEDVLNAQPATQPADAAEGTTAQAQPSQSSSPILPIAAVVVVVAAAAAGFLWYKKKK